MNDDMIYRNCYMNESNPFNFKYENKMTIGGINFPDNIVRKISLVVRPKIIDVIFREPVTVVDWSDGTKTIVTARNEQFDPEKGLAMAICKKFLGNYTEFDNVLKNAQYDNGMSRKERKALKKLMETPMTTEEFLSYDLGADEPKE